MNRLNNKTLSRLINIGILVTTLILSYLLFRNYYRKSVTPTPAARTSFGEDLIGRRLELPNVDWTKTNQTVVLALKSDCQFCRDSIPFYKKLSDALTERSDIQMIVLRPDTDQGIEESANDFGLKFREVRPVSLPSTLGSIGLTGVPAVLVLDRNGTITQAWQGLLTAGAESEVLLALGLPADRDKDPHSDNPIERIDISTLRKMMKDGQLVTVIDVRDRAAYARGHFDDAVNIPQDELSVRAINELNQSDLIVIYSYSSGDATINRSYLTLKKEGFKQISELEKPLP